jgi:O-antigen/teichoic acid export membrane protein
VTSSILLYSSLGLVSSLPKFLPELEVAASPRDARQFLWRLGGVRFALLGIVLIPLNLWAEDLARQFNLGADGKTYVHLLTLLLLAQAGVELTFRALEALLQQLAANALLLLQAALRFVLVGLAVLLGLGMTGVFVALGLSAAGVALAGGFALARRLQLPAEVREPPPNGAPAPSQLWRFSGLAYLCDLCLYFATPAFASPALAVALGGPQPVALFATSYFVAFSTVMLMASVFRGVYRPLFARLRAEGDLDRLRRAFDLVTKLQLLALVPAGAGLAVMVPDYLPLLYGESFSAAAPVARVLVALMFTETAFALGLLVLWVDARYRQVLAAQAMLVAGAPLFLWAAATGGLLPAAFALGGTRLGSSLFGYAAARRAYGVRYPWAFAGRVGLVSTVMAAALVALRQVWPTSPLEALSLTMLGVSLVVIGLRVGRVVGPAELEVLAKTNVPGKQMLLKWLAAGVADPASADRSRA